MRRLAVIAAASAFAGCDPHPSFSQAAIDAENIGGDLPQGFLLGTATAAHQIEGGENNDWTDWEAASYPDGTPHIKNGDTSNPADGSWTRWPQDITAMRTLGVNAYRLSLEWSRLEPQQGVWDATAAANYRSQLAQLRADGIQPMVTVHHYTFPKWVAAQGGWEWDGVSDALAEYAGQLASHFGDLVDLWCTVNEPNVTAYEAYLIGDYPPGVKDLGRTAKVYAETLKAHAKMAAAIKQYDLVDADGDGVNALVGVAHHVRVFEPASSSTTDTMIAALTDDFFNEAVPRAAKTGRIQLSVPGQVSIDEEVTGLAGSFDYLGINYYSRDFVRFDAADPSLSKQFVPAGRPTNDLGWDVYPEGLYRMLVRFGRYGWPMYVTENGIADASGANRPEFLRAHLYALTRALKDGVDVRGYLHWSLMDNFEWATGYSGRFGLFRVDVTDPNLVRQRTPAVDTWRQIATEAGLSPVGP